MADGIADSNALGPVADTPTPPTPSPGAPGLVTSPVVTGTVREGETLSCTDGTWTNSPTSITFQWQRDAAGNLAFSSIGGATANTYLLAAADVGCNIRCRVTASNL